MLTSNLHNYAFGFDAETLLPKVYDPAFDPSSITKVAVHESGKLCAEVAVLPQNLTVCRQSAQSGLFGHDFRAPEIPRPGPHEGADADVDGGSALPI